jgi:two-component sensor histidine kinase
LLACYLSRQLKPKTRKLPTSLDNIARINSIASVHRLLTGEMKDEVEIVGMIRNISSPTVSSVGGVDIELIINGPPITLPAKKGTPIALVINELIINSIKHGFAGKSHGKIMIDIKPNDGSVVIAYRDDGIGLSRTSPKEQKTGLGIRIINSLVKGELNGKWQQRTRHGYEASISFPLDDLL